MFPLKRDKGEAPEDSAEKPAAAVNPDAPWIDAGRRHEDRYFRLDAQVANWRKGTFAALFIAALAVSGVVYIGSKSKFVPYLVEVDQLGRVLAVRVASEDDGSKGTPTTVYREIFELFEHLRTVTTDRDANNKAIEKGFALLRGAARTYARTELRKAPPNEVGTKKTVQVEVKSAMPIGGRSWQIEWEEHSRSLQGEFMGTEVWRATIQFKLEPSDKEGIFRRNPIGFYVDELSWQKVLSR